MIFRRKRALPRIEVLELNPDDTLVVTCPGPISMDEAARIKGRLEKITHGQIVVVDGGVEFAVLKAGAKA